MKFEINLLELFSGIGGFTKGFQQAGYEIKEHFFSEIDKHAVANYKYNYPHAKHLGSVTEFKGSSIPKTNVTTFGFPCQDLSIAGKRLGFLGKRSSLFYQAARVLRENQSDCFVWENVAGLLSSNDGNDLKAVFEELYLSGYVFDVNLINTFWFLPQNRLRLYSIGYNIKYLQSCIINQNGVNTNWNLFVKILEGKLLTKYPSFLTEVQSLSELRQKELELEYFKTLEESQTTGQNLKLKYLETISILPLEKLKNLFHDIQKMELKLCDTKRNIATKESQITPHGGIKLGMESEVKTEKEKFILSIETLLSNISEENFLLVNKFTILTLINETTVLKTFSYAEMQLNIELYIIHLNLLYPKCWNVALSNLIENQKNIFYAKNRANQSRAEQKNNNNAVQLSFAEELRNDSFGHLANRSECGVFPITECNRWTNERATNTPIVRCLTAGGKSGGHHSGMTLIKSIVSKPHGFFKGSENFNNAPTVKCGSFEHQNFVKVAHVSRTDEAKEIQKESMKNGKDYTPFQGKNLEFKDSDVMNTITCATQKDNLIKTNNIRRLTEIECERLQGFEDDWTKYGIYEKQVWINKKEKTFEIIEEKHEVPKTQRYKMCGNAVTVNVVQAIAERIKFFNQSTK